MDPLSILAVEGQAPGDCIDTFTTTVDFEVVFAESGTICFQCDFDGEVINDSTFLIANAEVNPSEAAVVDGILIIFNSSELFDSSEGVSLRCFDGSRSFTTFVFLSCE